MEANEPRVLAAVVNYKRTDLTLETVRSLSKLGLEAPMRIVVVDNASGDAELSGLRAALPAGVEVLALPTNDGYGAACNAAIRESVRQGIAYAWLLNNDIAFEPGCLRELVRVLDGDDALAACAPVVVEFDRPDVILSSGMRVRLRFGKIAHLRIGRSVATLPAVAERVDALEASALLVRTRAAAACGGFDEDFFMYSEDVDWSLRARAGGWSLASSPVARIRHRVSQSSAPLDRIEYLIRNRIRTIRIHGSRIDQVTFMTYMVFGWLPAYAVMRLLFRHGPAATARAILRPIAWNIRDARRRGRWRLRPADQRIGRF